MKDLIIESMKANGIKTAGQALRAHTWRYSGIEFVSYLHECSNAMWVSIGNSFETAGFGKAVTMPSSFFDCNIDDYIAQ